MTTTIESEPSSKILTLSEVAELLRVHATTVYRLSKAGKLPGFKIGYRWRFSVQDIDRWRRERTPPPAKRHDNR